MDVLLGRIFLRVGVCVLFSGVAKTPGRFSWEGCSAGRQNASLILFDPFRFFDCAKMARFWMRRRLRIIFISHWYTVSYLIFFGLAFFLLEERR